MSRQTDRCVNKERKKAHLPRQTEKTHLCLGRSVPARGGRAVTACNTKRFWTTIQEPWKRWKELPPGSEDAAFNRIPTSRRTRWLG